MGKRNDREFESVANRFELLGAASPLSTEVSVVPYRFGHLVAISAPKSPIPPEVAVNQRGGAIAQLGYLFSHASDESRQTSTSLLRQVTEQGEKCLESCEGEFAVITYDDQSQSVHIVNDRFAARPIYVFRESEAVYFASNVLLLKHLCPDSLSPDVLGWIQMFSHSHTIGTRTNLQGVERLRPASHVVVTPNETVCRQYWRLQYEVDNAIDPASAADDIFEAFASATRRRAQLVPRGSIGLSGGLDSRMVAGVLSGNSCYRAFTFVDSLSEEDTPEVIAARKVARVAGLSHEVSQVATSSPSRLSETIVRLTGGLTPIHHPLKTWSNIQHMERHDAFQLGGGPGDVLAGSYISNLSSLEPENLEKQVSAYCNLRTMWGQSPSQALARMFRDEVVEEYVPRLWEEIRNSFHDAAGPTAAHTITSWAMTYRQPAFTFTSPIHNYPMVAEASPHLGYDYSDLMLRLPAEYLYQRNFYTYMIYQALPALREIEYSNTGKCLNGQLVDYSVPSDVSSDSSSSLATITETVKRCLPQSALSLYRKSRDGTHVVRNAMVRARQNRLAKSRNFNYRMLRSDTTLLSQTIDSLESCHSLRTILDVEKCEKFLRGFFAGRVQTRSPRMDSELVGSLISMTTFCRVLELSA